MADVLFSRPNLGFVTGLIEVVGSSGESVSVSLNGLRRAGALDIGRASAPNQSTSFNLSLNKLQSIGGGLQVQNNNTLNSLSLTALQSIGGGLTISDNLFLTRVNLLNLVTVGVAGAPEDLFAFEDNARDAAVPVDERILITLPATPAQVFGEVRIRDNRRMSNALATSFAARLAGTSVNISGNAE